MALDSFRLFLSQVRSSPEITQDTRVQIVFDMLYKGGFLGQGCHRGTLSFRWRIMKLIQAYVFVFGASDERVLTTCAHTRQVLKSLVVRTSGKIYSATDIGTVCDGDVIWRTTKKWCQVLGRLHLPEMLDNDKIRTLKLLVHNVFMVPLTFPFLTHLPLRIIPLQRRPRRLRPQRPLQIIPTSWLDLVRKIDDSSSSRRCFALW